MGEKEKEVSDMGDDGNVEVGEQSVVSQDPAGATSLKKTHRIKFKDDEPVKKVVLNSDKRKGEKEKEKKEEDSKKKSEEEEKDKGKTLMELLELEMRARAIK